MCCVLKRPADKATRFGMKVLVCLKFAPRCSHALVKLHSTRTRKFYLKVNSKRDAGKTNFVNPKLKKKLIIYQFYHLFCCKMYIFSMLNNFWKKESSEKLSKPEQDKSQAEANKTSTEKKVRQPVPNTGLGRTNSVTRPDAGKPQNQFIYICFIFRFNKIFSFFF